MNATSSKSWPVLDCPFAAATPTTSNGIVPMRIDWPTGLVFTPKSLSVTVRPSTTTLVPASTSCVVNALPSSIGQLRMKK